MNKFKVGDWVKDIKTNRKYKIYRISGTKAYINSFLFSEIGDLTLLSKQEVAKQFLTEVEKLSKEYGMTIEPMEPDVDLVVYENNEHLAITNAVIDVEE